MMSFPGLEYPRPRTLASEAFGDAGVRGQASMPSATTPTDSSRWLAGLTGYLAHETTIPEGVCCESSLPIRLPPTRVGGVFPGSRYPRLKRAVSETRGDSGGGRCFASSAVHFSVRHFSASTGIRPLCPIASPGYRARPQGSWGPPQRVQMAHVCHRPASGHQPIWWVRTDTASARIAAVRSVDIPTPMEGPKPIASLRWRLNGRMARLAAQADPQRGR